MDSSNLIFIVMMFMSYVFMTHGQSSYTCTCQCPSGTYQQSTTSPICSGQACASICLLDNSNSGCTSSNTYGCCGSDCAYYYSSLTTSGTCNCLCSYGLGYGTVSVGTLSVGAGSCTSNYCQQYCSSTYPSTCGSYLNYAYCISDTSSTNGNSNHNSGINIYKSCPLPILLVSSILSLKMV
jgi:hypothetical protein